MRTFSKARPFGQAIICKVTNNQYTKSYQLDSDSCNAYFLPSIIWISIPSRQCNYDPYDPH